MTATINNPRPICGWMGFILGATSLVAAVTLFWVGPFAPLHSAGVTVGELTAEIVKSSVRNLLGWTQPGPQVLERNIDDYLEIVIAATASVSIVLGVAAFIRKEKLRLAVGAGVLGASTIAFQFFIWYSMALLFVLLVGAIYKSFGEVVSGFLE